MGNSATSPRSWQIIHQTASRARLRLNWLKDYPGLHSSLQSSLINLDWVEDVQLSPVNNALVLYYDVEKISPAEFIRELDRVLSFTAPGNWYEIEGEKTTDEPTGKDENDGAIIGQIWDENKQTILMGVGTSCFVIGTIFTPLPFVPGWPFLLLGAYCIKLGTEEEKATD